MASTAVEPRSLGSLARTSVRALAFLPPLYVDSVLGHPWTWVGRHREDSEFRIGSPLQPRRLAEYLADVSMPGFARAPWSWLPKDLEPLIWRPTRVFFHPDHRGRFGSNRKDRWFFINGVATNEAVAEMNARCLAKLFHRPLTVILNSTNSLLVDLAECALGKGLEVMTEPARVAFPLVAEALVDPKCERVVLICHSQGTIIASTVLRALASSDFRRELYGAYSLATAAGDIRLPAQLDRALDLRKLEIYAFANCADRMEQVPGLDSRSGRNRVPWIESFGNEHDLVARLGMLAPDPLDQGIRIDGAVYWRRGAWGHLLNEHHLFAIGDHLEEPGHHEDPYQLRSCDVGEAFARPRLYEYFAGGETEPY